MNFLKSEDFTPTEGAAIEAAKESTSLNARQYWRLLLKLSEDLKFGVAILTEGKDAGMRVLAYEFKYDGTPYGNCVPLQGISDDALAMMSCTVLRHAGETMLALL